MSMDNLTRNLRLAWEAPDCSPRPGHDLVIYRRDGGGMRFLQVAADGARPHRGWFASSANLAAIAVSSDRHWNHAFFRLLLHVGQVHRFTLHCSIDFHVGDPRLLAEHLARDPLRCIEDEATKLFGHTAAHLEWTEIAAAEDRIGERVLAHPGGGRDAVVRSNLEHLQLFAAGYGIAIDAVRLQRTLGEEEVKVGITEADAAAQLQIATIEQLPKLQRIRLDGEVDKLSELRRAELARLEREAQADADAFRRRASFLDSSSKAAIDTLSRLAGHVNSFSDAGEALDEIERLRHHLLGSLAPIQPAGSLAAPAARAGMMNGAAALAPAASGLPGLAVLLESLARLFTVLPRQPANRQLAVAALHLLAEILDDDNGDADPGEIERHRVAIGESFGLLLDNGPLDDGAMHTLRRLQDVDALRREMA
jgi:hypothetical protein